MPTRDELGIERRRATTRPVRGVLIGIGVAVATVIAIGAVVLFRQGDDPPVADELSGEAAVAMAERFMEARDAHDLEEVIGLLAYPEAPDQYTLPFQSEQILGYRFDAIECVEDPEVIPTDEFVVVCTYVMDSRLREIAGLPPIKKSVRLRVLEAGIHPVIQGAFPWLRWDWTGQEWAGGGQVVYNGQVWGERLEFAGFNDWLAAEHPSTSLFSNALGTAGQQSLVLTPDNLRLLEAFLDEYERFVNG
jgi:hypothetical protein